MKLWLYMQQADLTWMKWNFYRSLTEVKKTFPGYGWAKTNSNGITWGITPSGTPIKVEKS